MLLILSLLLIVSFAVVTTALFRLKNIISYLLSIYLLIFANITITGHFAHLVNLLNKQWFYLLVEFFFLGISGVIWALNEKPHLASPFATMKKEDLSFSSLLKNPDLSLLSLFVIIAFGFQIYLVITVPPNNNDSLAMHVPRTLYWLQHGNYLPWETPRVAQVFYPVNAQLQMLWTVLFSNTWKFLGFPQFFSQIAASLAVLGITRLMKFKSVGQWFAGLAFLTYPIIVVQSSTTQNDLVIGALFGVCIYFLFLFFDEQKKLYLVFSGMAIVFAVGTKLTAVFLLPGLGIIAILAMVYQKIKFKEIVYWGISAIIAFLLGSSIIFFQNWKTFENPLGASSTVERATHATDSLQDSVNQVLQSSTKFIYQFIDPSGLPAPFWGWGIQLKARTTDTILSWLNIDLEDPAYTVNNHPFDLERYTLLQEDEAVFGIVGFLALLPLSLAAFIVGINRKDILLISPFLMFITFLLVETLLRPGWTPYQGRYFIPIALIATPLLGFLTNIKALRWSIVPLLAITAGFILINTMLYNPAKPLLDEPIRLLYRWETDPHFREITHYQQNVWELSFAEKVGLQTRSQIATCNLIEHNIPDNETVGFIVRNDNFRSEFCLFGEKFTRDVIPLYPYTEFSSVEAVQNSGVSYLLLYKPTEELLIQFQPMELIAVDDKGNTFIYKVD